MKGNGSTAVALRIAGLFVLFGVLWILFSDHIVMLVGEVPAALNRLQTIKGVFFVLASGALLFLFARREVGRRLELERSLVTEAQESFSRLERLVAVSGQGLWEYFPGSDRFRPTRSFRGMLGYPAEEEDIPGEPLEDWLLLSHPDDRGRARSFLRAVTAEEAGGKRLMHSAYDREGRLRWFASAGIGVPASGVSPAHVLGLSMDMTDWKASEEKLERSRALLRATVESVGDGILVVDGEHSPLLSNRRFRLIWGFPVEEETLPPLESRKERYKQRLSDADAFLESVDALYTAEREDEEGYDLLHFHDGRVFEWYSVPFRVGRETAGRVWTFRDLTDREQALVELQQSVEEKEALLREVHHRVKNNLQVVSSLLHLQMDTLNEGAAREALMESRNRVKSMSLVHERLYRSQRLSSINVPEYLKALERHIRTSYEARSGNIKTMVEGGPVELDVDSAISAGLLVTELLSNAFKHAFPDGRSGTVCVRVTAEGQSEVVLSVEDDGIGLPPGFDVEQTETLGLKMVTLLARQLNGSLDVEGPPGVRYTVRIPVGDRARTLQGLSPRRSGREQARGEQR
ncbi:MAG: hypothetical protein K9L28_03205 [Synergistales bacterium]|nr:hypothetical protein [Synergistales bacterium]